jgi:predicted acyl esterase
MQQHRSEVRDGMRIEWDMPVETDDGTVLRADVFRPVDDGRPVIMTHGPYAKGLAFQEGYPGPVHTPTVTYIAAWTVPKASTSADGSRSASLDFTF